MGIENPAALGPREEIVSLARAGNMEGLKTYVLDAVNNAEKVKDIENILQSESLSTVELILPVILDSGINDILKEKFALIAMQNPHMDVAIYAAGEMKRVNNMHIGILTDFDPNTPDSPLLHAQARTIALTFPTLPPKLREYILSRGSTDIVLTNALIKDATKDIAINTGIEGFPTVTGINEEQEQELINLHEDAIRQLQKNAFAKAMVTAGIPEEEGGSLIQFMAFAEVDVDDFRKDKEKALQKVLSYSDNLPEHLEHLKLTDAQTEKITKIAEALRADKTTVTALEEHETMKLLLSRQNKAFYVQYLRTYNDPTLTPTERVRRQHLVLQNALQYGNIDERALLLRALFNRSKNRVSSSVTDATEKSPILKKAVKAVAAVTAVKVIDELIPDDDEEEPEQKKSPVISRIGSSMKQAIIANRGSRKELGDGRVQVDIENEPVIFSMKNDKLTATVTSKDGKPFELPELTIASLERTLAIDVMQHDMQRSIWDKSYNDSQLLKYVFNLDFSDQIMTKKKQYEDQLAAMPITRKRMLGLYKSLGVLEKDLSVNRKQALRVRSLFSYLDASIGLEFIELDDLENIASVWEKSGKTDLMLPNAAREQLKQLNQTD